MKSKFEHKFYINVGALSDNSKRIKRVKNQIREQICKNTAATKNYRITPLAPTFGEYIIAFINEEHAIAFKLICEEKIITC